jgi:hypothetical protein
VGFTHQWVVIPHPGVGHGGLVRSTVRGQHMADMVYEISFKGAASHTLAAAFPGCEVAVEHGVTTVRSGVPDQARLQGLIARVNALGLELLEVHLVAEPAAADDGWARDLGSP